LAGVSEIAGSGFALGSIAILLSVNVRITLFVFLPLMGMVAMSRKRPESNSIGGRVVRPPKVTGLVGEMFTAVQAIQVAGRKPVLNQLRQVNERAAR